MPVLSQTRGYIPSQRTPQPIGRYQIILLGDRHKGVHNLFRVDCTCRQVVQINTPSKRTKEEYRQCETTNARTSRPYVRRRGRTFINTCRVYVHTPRELDRHLSHNSLEASHYNKGARTDSSDLGFWGSKVRQNGRFPAQDADEPPCKIWSR